MVSLSPLAAISLSTISITPIARNAPAAGHTTSLSGGLGDDLRLLMLAHKPPFLPSPDAASEAAKTADPLPFLPSLAAVLALLIRRIQEEETGHFLRGEAQICRPNSGKTREGFEDLIEPWGVGDKGLIMAEKRLREGVLISLQHWSVWCPVLENAEDLYY
eukprot:TRINITY_DN564_c0_g1_i16.p1 TRINITY_DN564_c0_g1~~TRINITY_DN564_c0_g1_i16.p1  ORF type:complete len:161 (+),score=24.02 TRINITY_DN564_c0_g1_i16:487-969(+)